MTSTPQPTTNALRDEAVELLRRLVICDTSNPPGREAQAVAILEDYLRPAGLELRRIAKDPERPNLLVRLPGSGDGPSFAFLGHLDVVQAKGEDWSVEPFSAVEKDGAIWGRGTVDMKSFVAATAVALAQLSREGFKPNGDLMLIFMADEEVGSAGVGAPFFTEELADLRLDYGIGEGAGERIPTSSGPIYLLDHGVKVTADLTLEVHGRPGDASLKKAGESALTELTRLFRKLEDYAPEPKVLPELHPLLDAVAPEEHDQAAQVTEARKAHPALDRIVYALTSNVFRPTVLEADGPTNVVPEKATATFSCIVLPGTTEEDIENELREVLGEGNYELEVGSLEGGLVSDLNNPLHAAIQDFLKGSDPEARLVPTLGYGFSDCETMRKAYGTTMYGFIPFRHADPVRNLETKHGINERVLIDDVEFQLRYAYDIATRMGTLENP